MPRDGHCFLHALRESISSYLRIHILEKSIASSLLCEFTNNFANYESFIAEPRNQFFVQLSRYFNNKLYNCNASDLLLIATSNAFNINIIIVHCFSSLNTCTKITPLNTSLNSDNSIPYIVIHLHNDYYSATKLGLSASTSSSRTLPAASMSASSRASLTAATSSSSRASVTITTSSSSAIASSSSAIASSSSSAATSASSSALALSLHAPLAYASTSSSSSASLRPQNHCHRAILFNMQPARLALVSRNVMLMGLLALCESASQHHQEHTRSGMLHTTSFHPIRRRLCSVLQRANLESQSTILN